MEKVKFTVLGSNGFIGSHLIQFLKNKGIEYFTPDVRKDDIFNNYLDLLESGEVTYQRLSDAKNRLLDLKLPTKFKDLHLYLVLAMANKESFLQTGNVEHNLESEKLIEKIKEDYDFLIIDNEISE